MTQTINTLIQKYRIRRDQFLHHKQIKSIIKSTLYKTNSTVHPPLLNEEIRKITKEKKEKKENLKTLETYNPVWVNETRNTFMI